MEDVTANKRKMKELEDNLLYKLTSTQVLWLILRHSLFNRTIMLGVEKKRD